MMSNLSINSGQVLPSGTVTFLFTDIEGSTRLAQQFPAELPALLAQHHAILRQSIEAHHGHVFQVVGDAFCASFHTARDALQAALDAQRGLQHEAWNPAPIKVRMGIHTGSAQAGVIDERAGGYVGYLTLTRVQRVMSIAYGGQVLLSNPTAELVRGELPADVTLRDMGEHRLKGLENLEHLWQLVAPDVRQDFPPLQSLNAIPNNLPVQLTSFIGREKELTRVQEKLIDYRLVTLTGSGGVGKTRLAIQAAHKCLPDYGYGAWLIELAPLADPALVPQAIVTTFGLQEDSARSPLAVLTDYLREKTLLLVLDNCEHVIDACAQLAEQLLLHCPDLHILASSREALGIDGEAALRVPSLSLPPLDNATPEALTQSEAAQLFIERASAALPGFALTEANAPAIAQVCRRLDGIALAIELAASRVKVLRVEQIADRLDDAFRFLTGGRRTALPRQQTLRATIDWSYSLLNDAERIVLRRLSVFAGGATLEAAEVVCSDDELEALEVLDILTQLVNKSLVVAEREQGVETRYALLETIRQYARDKLLESGEVEHTRMRHLEFFHSFAVEAGPRLGGPEHLTWSKRLDTEYDNLRAALDWAVESGQAQSGLRLGGALQFFWYVRGYWREGRERLERLLARPEAAEHTTARAAALYVAGFLAFWLRDSEAVQALLDESQAISLELGEAGKPILTRSRYLMAVETINRDRALAQRLLEENLVLARETGDTWVIGWTFYFQGNLAIRQGDYALARTFYGESLVQFRKDGNQLSAAGSIKALGRVSYLLEEYNAARSLFEEVVPIYREAGDKFSMAHALENLGYVAYQQGAHQQATLFFEESLALFRELERKDTIAWLLGDLGIAAGQQGNHAQAVALLSEALPLTQEVGDVSLTAMCLIGLAGIQQQPIRAAQLLAAAQTTFEASGEIVEPFHRAAQARIESNTCAMLGEAAFAAAWAEGQAMTIDQAMQLAMGDKD